MDSQPLPALRSDLRFAVHGQGKELWYAVQQSGSGRFLRLGKREYAIACAMAGASNIEELLTEVHKTDASLQVTEAHIAKLAEWMVKNDLVEKPGGPSPASVKPPSPKIAISPLYTKVPLLNGRHLEKVAEHIVPFVNRFTIAAAVVLWFIAGIAVLNNWQLFCESTGKLFVEDGRIWWLVAWFILKLGHELGHAVSAVYVGSQIRSAGVSFICMAPVPYVDITDLWMIPNRWHRMICCAAGMLVELTLAAIAALVALSTSNESLQYFCCAAATLGTVTTLAFNANPLVRFDGYFIVSDLLDRPNLWTDASLACKQFVRKLLHPLKPATHPMRPRLVLYGLACFQYRVIMLVTLAAWAILVWQGLGIILVVWCVYSMFAAPWLKMRQQPQPALAPPTDALLSRLDRFLGWGIAAAALGLFFILPSPVQPSVPGVISLRDPTTLRGQAEGFLTAVHVTAGQVVAADQIIAELENPQLALDADLKELEAIAAEEKMRSHRARGEMAEFQAEEANLNSLLEQLEQLESKLQNLVVRAPVAGTIVSSDLDRMLGKYFHTGEPLCLIAGGEGIELQASADQNDADALRSAIGKRVQVRMANGDAAMGVLEKVDPRASQELNSPSLAAIYGGSLTVEINHDASGNETLHLPEPRFRAFVRFEDPEQPSFAPGRLASFRIPGKSASLWHAAQRWLEKQWKQILKSAESSAA